MSPHFQPMNRRSVLWVKVQLQHWKKPLQTLSATSRGYWRTINVRKFKNWTQRAFIKQPKCGRILSQKQAWWWRHLLQDKGNKLKKIQEQKKKMEGNVKNSVLLKIYTTLSECEKWWQKTGSNEIWKSWLTTI